MSDFLRRVGAKASLPTRTRTEEAPQRLRVLLRDVLVEDHGWVAGLQVLAEAAGESAGDIWSEDWAAPRLRALVEEVEWGIVYAMLENSAPQPLAGLESYDERVNDVLAREGIAYEMRDGLFGPFDPEGKELGLDLANPADEAGEGFLPVRRQYERSLHALASVPADPLTAVRESVNAMEATARILTGKLSSSFGDLIGGLLGPEPHRKALAASMKSLYGYASTVPGARHGEHETVDLGFAEAAYAVRSAGATIAMLLAEHRGQPH